MGESLSPEPGHGAPRAVPSSGSPAPEEVRLGGTPAGRAANAALLALSKTARSFLIYEPRNEAVRQSLADVREKMRQALQAGGALSLEVRPFELVRAGEVVYLERDRERSLAFRMFRDGVRRLTIEPDVDWDELLRLLEILSIRYTGIRQQEDDIVTLLCKAGFRHIGTEAVEGFVPDEDLPEGGGGGGPVAVHRTAARVEAPSDWDLPLPPLLEPAPLAHQPVSQEQLAALQAEETSLTLPASAVRLVVEMLEAIDDLSDPTAIEDLLPYIGEIRDFLLAEGQLSHLTSLVRALKSAEGHDREPLASVLTSFGDERALRRILHSVHKGEEQAPAELVGLLDLVPSDHLAHLIDLLGVERGEASRRIARQLIERYAPGRADFVISRLRGADPAVARDLLLVCARALPDRAVDAALTLKDHPDVEVQLEVLQVLGEAPNSAAVARALLGMLSSPVEEVRLRAIELLAKHGERRAFDALLRHVEARAARDLTAREAEAIGQALPRIDATAAWGLFTEWTRPKGLLGRWVETPGQRMLHWTAVAGLGIFAGEEPEKLIRTLSERAGEDLRRHCLATLARRRRGAGGKGPSQDAGGTGASHG